MDNDTIVAVLYIHKTNQKIDIEIPLNISANELLTGLNIAFDLGVDPDDISQRFLKTENPIALLKGNKTLAEYKLRHGTIINITN
ncbi:MAG: EsaB/YukD family protein [Firmicutes bacterium]|nr:EsaB/YukD family protein [Bacillota bacterium]